MDPHLIYATSRQRLIDLAPVLTPEQLAAPLAATPPWTVADGYRHLTGVCTNVLDGVMDGAGSPPWTEAQIDSRRELGVGEVCAEWADRAPMLDAQVAAAGTAMAFVAFDVWTHEQDIRAAAGFGGLHDEIADALAGVATTSFAQRYATKGAPTLRIDYGDGEATLGDGDPQLTLATSRYELLRMIFGRRSRTQMEAAAWSGTGDAAAAIDALHLFDFPPHDITD